MIKGETRETPKYNRPLIVAGVIAGLLMTAVIVGVVAMYIANFNLLQWLE